jgi:hypothetical protein
MNSGKFIGILLATCLIPTLSSAQSLPSPPNLAGKWVLVKGSGEADGPLGKEGIISQSRTAVTFRSATATRAIAIPFDGSKTKIQDENGPVLWEYQGSWIGFAFVVSMKGSGRGFEDLMVVTPSGPGTMTMVIMRTPTAAGKVMHTSVLTYEKS